MTRTNTIQIKTCRCCGTRATTLRQRKCRTCGVQAIWDIRSLTETEIADRNRQLDSLEALLKSL